MTDSWRYIPLIEASGQLQMSIDLYLLENYRMSQGSSILRFYTWSPVAISLGRHQYQYPQYWQEIYYQGCHLDIIKRPTGGRAVLHQGDLCYSLITLSPVGSFRQGYMKFCQFLLEGWDALGVELTYGKDINSYVESSGCFGSSTTADLVDHLGIKRIGNAQLRRKNVILQQGSMSLNTDEYLYRSIFQQEAPKPIQITNEAIISSLEIAFNKCFQTQLVKQSLQPEEWDHILSRNDDKLHIVNS